MGAAGWFRFALSVRLPNAVVRTQVRHQLKVNRMNAEYLILGLLCGIAIGYAFGWQERRSKRRLIEAAARRAALLDARAMIDSNHCDGESQWASGINEARKVNLLRIDYLLAQDADCAGGIRCSSCPGKSHCASGCTRQTEA
jgi:hypothetical protein